MDPSRLSPSARRVVSASRNELFLSGASEWEIAIKYGLRKLELAIPLAQLLNDERRHLRIAQAPLTTSHFLQVATLPLHHRDPFDRIIVAQALVEGLALVSADSVFDAYGAKRIW